MDYGDYVDEQQEWVVMRSEEVAQGEADREREPLFSAADVEVIYRRNLNAAFGAAGWPLLSDPNGPYRESYRQEDYEGLHPSDELSELIKDVFVSCEGDSSPSITLNTLIDELGTRRILLNYAIQEAERTLRELG